MDFNTTLIIASGLWIGNWLVCPLVFKNRSFTDGFWIGMIVAGLTVIVGAIF